MIANRVTQTLQRQEDWHAKGFPLVSFIESLTLYRGINLSNSQFI
jgi:hypothetical protein